MPTFAEALIVSTTAAHKTRSTPRADDIMKGTSMAAPQRPIPLYEQLSYQFCDLIQEIVDTNPAGAAWAPALIGDAITNIATYFPRAAKAALGDQFIVAHKSAAATLPVRLKASAPVDDFDRLGQQIAAAARTQAMQAGSDRATIMAHLGTVLAQLSAAQPHAGALTDQGASSLKSSDPLVAAFQGDLSSDMVPR
jgi:hypothetical protein